MLFTFDIDLDLVRELVNDLFILFDPGVIFWFAYVNCDVSYYCLVFFIDGKEELRAN